MVQSRILDDERVSLSVAGFWKTRRALEFSNCRLRARPSLSRGRSSWLFAVPLAPARSRCQIGGSTVAVVGGRFGIDCALELRPNNVDATAAQIRPVRTIRTRPSGRASNGAGSVVARFLLWFVAQEAYADLSTIDAVELASAVSEAGRRKQQEEFLQCQTFNRTFDHQCRAMD